MPRLLSIQYLRAIAALMVVAYHSTRWIGRGFTVGAAGVDVFFIVSGFILWTIASSGAITPAVFLRRRWARVAPLYWLLTLVVAGVALVWPLVFWDAKPTLGHVLLSMAFVQHFNPDHLPFPLISAGWTLNYEAVFYLIFAVSLIAPRRFRLWVITALLVAMPIFGRFIYEPAYFVIANGMFLEFAAGVWLAEARLHGRLPQRRTGLILAIMGVAALMVGYALGIPDGVWRPLIWGVPAFFIVLGAVAVEADGGVREVGWLRYLGDASYSIYLAHFLAVQLVSHLINTSHWWFAPIGLTAGVGAGIVCYQFVERPLSALLRPRRIAVLPCATT